MEPLVHNAGIDGYGPCAETGTALLEKERAVYGGTKGYVVTVSRTLAAEPDGAPVRDQG
ncbi:hypothetical protein GCM10010103_61780 [Streptomyces paradoxus]|uniref:Uncharacterized protein n=1 Tax=Streptomyces paradoxus TaxID=66375 RepID=A0A7W9TKB5_9ACTN|nr:hypothetical protein [Streptomyces paradoxus]MBB6081222.1 hypothetical protein [Streptomyces paradoxus]